MRPVVACLAVLAIGIGLARAADAPIVGQRLLVRQSGKAMARTGLRMMPTSPSPPSRPGRSYAAPSLCGSASATDETFPPSLPCCPRVPPTLRRWVHGPLPVVLGPRCQTSSCYQRVATHTHPSLPAIPDGVVHFGAASFASCCGPRVCPVLQAGYDTVDSPTVPAEAPCHSRFRRRPSPAGAGSQAGGANGQSPLVGTCTQPVRGK